MQPTERRRRRLNPFVIVGVVCILILLPLFCISRKSPGAYAADFMTALGNGDVNKLAELSIIGNDDLATRKKLWQESVDNAKYYTFTWRITNETDLSDTEAAVTLQMRRNLQLKMGEDEEPYQLKLIKKDGEWKVLVDGMNREIYPYLPRP